MSPRLLLDGEDLRALMLRVREEMGPDARIVKAERVRTGGVGGFFAREHYELTVEVPDPPAGRPAPRAARRRTAPAAPGEPQARADLGLDALLAAADEAERRESLDDDGGSGGPGAGAGGTGDRDEDAPPTVSTDGETFAEVLDSVVRMVDPAQFTPSGLPPVVDPPVPARGDHDATGPGDVRGADGATAGADGATAGADAARAGADAAVAGGGPTGVDGDPDVIEVSAVAQTDDVGTPAAGGPTAGAAAEGADAAEVADDRPGSTAAGLLELGIPARLLAGVTDLTAEVPVSVLVRRFGRPPAVRLTKGNVVAVVGAGPVAFRVATQMAHRAGLAERDVMLAGEIEAVPGHGRRLQTGAALAKFRAKASPDELHVVVLGVGEGPEALRTAAEMLEAVEPTQAWAVVDARRRAAELRRWLRAVGSRRAFDALAVHSTGEAQSPGVVLGLGHPVGWLDGLPANPLVWAALLSERLADDARWD